MSLRGCISSCLGKCQVNGTVQPLCVEKDKPGKACTWSSVRDVDRGMWRCLGWVLLWVCRIQKTILHAKAPTAAGASTRRAWALERSPLSLLDPSCWVCLLQWSHHCWTWFSSHNSTSLGNPSAEKAPYGRSCLKHNPRTLLGAGVKCWQKRTTFLNSLALKYSLLEESCFLSPAQSTAAPGCPRSNFPLSLRAVQPFSSSRACPGSAWRC